jgi:DNA repair protein RadC
MSGGVHTGHRERLRERFLRDGLDRLEDHVVLELLLCYAIPRRDVNQLAHELLNRFGSLSGVLDAEVSALRQVPGVGENAATLLALVPALCRRYQIDRSKTSKRLRLDETAKAGAFFLPYFYGAREEKVYAAYLDEHLRFISCAEAFQGGLSHAQLSIRKLVEAAISQRAACIILAHNHPGGVAMPSVEDREATMRIYHALEAVQIRLVDHIIVAEDEFLSMEECGYFHTSEERRSNG